MFSSLVLESSGAELWGGGFRAACQGVASPHFRQAKPG